MAAVLVLLSFLWFLWGREGALARRLEGIGAWLGHPAGVLLRNRAIWVLALCQTGAAVAFSAFITFYPGYAMDRMGISLTAVGLIMGVFSVGGLLGSFTSGPLPQWKQRRKPFVWLPGLLLPAIYAGLVYADSVPLAALLQALAGVCAMGVAPVIFTIPLDLKLAPREVAVAQALLRTMFPVGATIGPLLVAGLEAGTGSLALGLYVVAPLALSLFVGGVLLPETGSRAK